MPGRTSAHSRPLPRGPSVHFRAAPSTHPVNLS
jgi:hypothetical protein